MVPIFKLQTNKHFQNCRNCIKLPYMHIYRNHDSSVGIALGYGLDDRGSRVRFPRGLGIFLFTTASRTVLGPTQPPIQWVPGALSLRVKRPGRVADHSLPSSSEVKEWVELYLHSPNTPSWRGTQLKHRDNFTFYMHIHTYIQTHTYRAGCPKYSTIASPL
jgi:hypothetical protein